MRLVVVCLVILGLAFADQRVRYDRYKVYRVTPKSLDEAKLLKTFENNVNFDFWSDLRMLDDPVDIMVAPVAQNSFEETIKKYKLDYHILINDVEETIQKEDVKQRASPRLTRGEVTFTDFMRYDDIIAYLEQLALLYPTIVRTEVIGRTFEGRNMTAIRISSGGTNKPTIFAEAAIHAREWIAPPVALYLINQLVENSTNAPMYRDIDWIIIPVTNPDGYEYTHTNERFWRKTRSPGSICDGVDGNRNFDFSWNVIGASSWQCDETYAGYAPFTEPETQAIRDYTLANKDNIKLFLSIHSYGQWFLYPWGHIRDEPENSEELRYLGGLFQQAVSTVEGTLYQVGTTANLLYFAAGISIDWARAAAGVNLSYTIELPRGGDGGFNPPATRIEPIVVETWEGLKALHGYIQDNYVN